MMNQVPNTNFSYNYFKDFSKANEMSSNRTYLKNAYGHDIQYYNDTVDFSENKKKKRNKALIFGSVALIGAGAILSAFAYGKKIPLDSLKEGKYKEGADKLFGYVQNACANFTTIKDALWMKVEDRFANIPVLRSIKKGSNRLTKFYADTLTNGTKDRLIKILGSEDAYKQYMSKINLNSDLSKVMSDMVPEFENGKAVNGLLDSLKPRDLFNKVAGSGIRDNIVTKKYKDIVNLKAAEELLENKKLELTPDKIKKCNELIQKEFLPKAGDIVNGCAPTDIITAAIPVFGFGAAVAGTKEKEKRNSLILNLGVPLFPTFLMPLVGLKFPILNGFKGMIAGFAVGQVVKQGVKLVNKKLNKNNENVQTKQ